MVKQFYLIMVIFSILVFTASCTIQPIWKLSYLNKHEDKGLPKTNGCYYYLDYSHNDSAEKILGYRVFFKNGLVKRGGIKFNGVNLIEEGILADLKTEYYNLPYVWETYILKEDTLLMQYLLPTYVIVGDIGYVRGVFESDSVLRVFKIQHAKTILEVNQVYKFLSFSTPPDSTGYLYDKLQKKKDRELKKRKKGKG